MAVTPAEHEGKRPAPPGRERGRAEEKPRRPRRQLVGYLLAGVVLLIYFFWLDNDMGGATSNGRTELAAVFGAVLLAVLALAAGAFLGHRRGD
jgi:hypothetical protein